MGFIPALIASARNNWRLVAGISGWVLLVPVVMLYLEKRDDFAAETVRCEKERIESIMQADRVARRAAERAAAANLADLDKMAAAVAAAEKRIVEARLRGQEAEIRLSNLIEELSSEEPESCLNSPVDPAIVRGLRGGASRRPPGAVPGRPD